MKDYYKILGITREASTDVIKQKFKELAFENHPDVSDKKNAGEIFIEIYEAYHILSDPDRKASYDMLHNKYFYKTGTHIPNEAILKNDILCTSSSLREKAQKKAKVTYRDFMKEMDCFFKKNERADGKPFSYGMHKNVGISGGTGPMGSIKSRTVRIPIPRSKKAYLIHRVGFLVKLIFFILGLAVLRFDLIPSADLYSKMLILPASIIIGSLITYSIYHSTKTKSKFFNASRFFLVKKYKKNGYRRGSHPMVSTTPVGWIIYILRILF